MAPADAGYEQLADEAAPLDVLLVDAAAGPLRRFAPDASTAKFAVALARRPVTTARRLGSLAAELARIGAGTSALAPAKRDRRFADPAWTENLLLRRIVQAYLAAGMTADQLVGDAALDWRDDKRVRFLVENLDRCAVAEQCAAGEPGVRQGGHRHRRRQLRPRGDQPAAGHGR